MRQVHSLWWGGGVLWLSLTACQAGQVPAPSTQATGPAPPAPAASPAADAGPGVRVIASGLEHPWSVALLPDGGFLVTERPGRLRRVAADGTVSAPVAGVPKVFAEGQGGLLDVALA